MLSILSKTVNLYIPSQIQVRHYRVARELPALTPEQREVLLGCALGDLCIVKGKGYVNSRLQFAQGAVNRPYLMHLYSLFENSCGSAPKIYPYRDGRETIAFNTLSSPILNEFRELFYSEGVKTVPPTIGELLTARGLAYWAMD
jgi:hypothetical protein